MTLPARFRKPLRDIAATPFRTVLALLAMVAGTFGLGMILTAHSILTREVAASFAATRPSSATLVLDAIDDRAVAAARTTPGVRDAEARPMLTGRLRVGTDQWASLVLYVVRDFRDLRLDRLRPEAGAWPPADDQVILERSGLPVARAALGDRLTVRYAQSSRRLSFAGTSHAAGLAPGWMDHVVTGFVSWNSTARGTDSGERAELRILVDGNRLDESHIREVASRVKARLAALGHTVIRIDVPPPGRHPHADQMDTFLFLLGAFAALTLALSAVLVANLMHALLAEQLPQVGVMKALGASTRQIAALYLAQVATLAAASLALGLPLGLAAGRAYARFAGSMLNLQLRDESVGPWTLVLQIAVGLGIPLLVALGPVAHASRISIQQTFSNDVGRRPYGHHWLDRLMARLAWLPRPLGLSLRATFQRRARLILTVSTLALGGAVFLSAMNVSLAWARAIDADAATRRYDIDLRLSVPATSSSVASLLTKLPEVQAVESWPEAPAALLEPGGNTTAHLTVIGPDAGTDLLHPRLLQGRWLTAGDTAAGVVSQTLLARHPSLQLGSPLRLRLPAGDVRWVIVGVVQELNPSPVVYAPPVALRGTTGLAPGLFRHFRVVTRRHDEAGIEAAQRSLEAALASAGIPVLDTDRLADRRRAFADHLVILESALMLAAWLVILVGGLGLATSLSLNVAERSRELAILNALGATPRQLARYVVFEALLLGGLSAALALLLALPVTLVLDAVTGQIFIKSSLAFCLSPRAVIAWFILAQSLGVLSSLYPARRAAQLTIREALAHA